MSVNDVPGWLVTMAPSAIGVPVAGTPGFVPHWDVPAVPADALLLAGAALVEVPLDEVVPFDDGVLDELLQPATVTRAAAAASTIVLRTLGACRYIVIFHLLASRA
jgi:hypothetical protein